MHKRTGLVKFHFHTQQGIQNLSNEEAEKLIGQEFRKAIREIYMKRLSVDFPKWTMYIQVMPEEEAEQVDSPSLWLNYAWSKTLSFNWSGRIWINRNPANFFADVEQSAFAPVQFGAGD